MVAAETGARTASFLASSLGLVGLWLVILPVVIVALRIYKPPEEDLFA